MHHKTPTQQFDLDPIEEMLNHEFLDRIRDDSDASALCYTIRALVDCLRTGIPLTDSHQPMIALALSAADMFDVQQIQWFPIPPRGQQ